MKPIAECKCIQIEITNACNRDCANCHHLIGHQSNRYFMDLATVVKAIDSLEGFPGNIGLMGGEPTMHPKFREICQIFQMKIPDRRRREFWTNGYKWDEYEDIIYETFDKDLIVYNDHSTPDGKHHPMLVAIQDVMDDEEEMWKLIDGCWKHDRWSAAITPKGCFFCEVAMALDHALGGPGGYPIEKDWWKKDFKDQVRRYCKLCGATIPIGETSDNATYDLISMGNLEKLDKAGSPKVKAGNFAIYNRKWAKEQVKERLKGWKPYIFRNFYASCPDDVRKAKIRNSKDYREE